MNRAGHYKAFKLEQLIGVAECAAKGELTAQEVLDIIQTQYAHAANQVPGRITIVYGMKGESPEDWQEVHVNRTSNFVPKPGAEVKEIMFTPDGNNRYPIDAKHRTSCSGKGRPKSQCYGKAVHGLVIEGEGVYMTLDVLVSAAKRVRDRLPAGATSNADADREDPSATGPAPAPTEPGKSESRGWGFYAGGGYAASLDDSLNFNLALVRAGVIIPTERINGKLHVRLGVLGLGGSGTEDENAAAPNPNDPAGTQGVSYLESTVAGGALEGGVSFNLDPIMLHVAAALGVGNHHSELYQELWANGSLVSNEPPIPQNQVNPIAALSAGIGFNICKYAGLDFEGIMVLAPNRHGKVTPAAGGMVNLRFNIPGISK